MHHGYWLLLQHSDKNTRAQKSATSIPPRVPKKTNYTLAKTERNDTIYQALISNHLPAVCQIQGFLYVHLYELENKRT